MKLDVSNLRYLEKDDFRVLMAIELGMRNHEYVPVELIAVLAGLRHGGIRKILLELGRFKLVHRETKKYEGYRLTYPGYDYLALNALFKRGTVTAVGRQIGVGKESDIFLARNEAGDDLVLKLHRLGRISFRRIKEVRRGRSRGGGSGRGKGEEEEAVVPLAPSSRLHRSETISSTADTDPGCTSPDSRLSRSTRS